MSKKEKKTAPFLLGAAVLIAAAVFPIKIMSMGFDVPDCKAMAPLPIGQESGSEYLSLADKTSMSWNKFGFRKKLVVHEPSVVLLQASCGSSDAGYYGIYKDKKLMEPVEEIPFTWEGRNGGWEEGLAEYIPQEVSKDGIVLLEPGTYYLAVYTTKAFADEEVSFLSYIGSLNENCKLSEGKKTEFYTVPEIKKNIFEIKDKRQGRIKITADVYGHGAIKVYDNEHRLLFRKALNEEDGRTLVEPVLDIDAETSYYMEVSQMKIPEDSHLVDVFSVKYEYL